MSSNSNTPDQNSSNVLDLNKFRARKSLENEVGTGRKPLFISHMDGIVKGSPNFKRPSTEDFGDRIQRIRQSLEKINTLMAELKRQSQETLAKTERSTPIKD